MKLINILVLSICLLLLSCAQISAPTGGEKDLTPPALVSEKTFPANYSTNFNSKTITLTFDEYFTVSNPNQNILIAPILDNAPKFTTKGKKLVIELNDTLKENTTYTINFGTALKDFNAGNILKNFSYVFSTGTFIDSMQTTGIVIDAFTGAPIEGIQVMLFDNLYDSTVSKDKPNYVTLTDKTGKYYIKHIKEGEYKVYALKDENRNYMFDLPNEKIAFLDSTIILDTNNKDNYIKLQLFEEDYKKQQIVSKKYSYPGKLDFVLKKPSKVFTITDTNNKKIVFHQIEKSKKGDSITLWNTQNELNKTQLIVTIDTLVDTVLIYPYKKSKTDTLAKLVSLSKKIDFDQHLTLNFNRPIQSIDTSKITILKDSIKTPITGFKIDSTDNKKVSIQFSKKPEEQFTLSIYPTFVKDIYGANLADTIHKNISVREKDFYGSLTFNLQNTNPKYQYIIQLLKNSKVIKEHIYKGKKIAYPQLVPAKYSVRIIIDENNNNQWDTGDYYQNKQPEKVLKYSKTIEIRSNWELEESWDLKD